jgi:hypothetical protein
MPRSFDGITDRVDWTNPYNQSGNPITISLWVKPRIASVSASEYLIVSHVAGDASFGSFILTRDAGPRLAFLGIFSSVNLAIATGLNVLSTTEWTHIVVTWDGSTPTTSVKIYSNNVDQGQANVVNGSGTPGDGSGSLSMGGRIFDNNRNYDGSLCYAAVWDRELSEDERFTLFERMHPTFIRNGLVWASDLEGFYGTDNLVANNPATLDGTAAIADFGGMMYPSHPLAAEIKQSPTSGLSIPIAMHHYKQMMGAN